MATTRSSAPRAPAVVANTMKIVRNPSLKVRQAVRDNNVPLLARLQHKTDLRNTDRNRLTSLSWAAIEGSLEVFEWLLLDYGHDDQELSRDSDSNTVLHLLASIPSPPTLSPHTHLLSSSPFFPPRPSTRSLSDQIAISLRMTHLYHALFPFLTDWSNSGGKTALHVAAQAGNTAFIDLLCDFGADVDLTDLQGNTPLHYASAWGHVAAVRVLLERDCQYATRNFEGFTASDFAYSNTVMGSLISISREVYEERRTRRRVEAAEIGRSGSGGALSSQGMHTGGGAAEGRFRSGSVSTNLSVGSGSAVSSNLTPNSSIPSRRPSATAPTRPVIHEHPELEQQQHRHQSHRSGSAAGSERDGRLTPLQIPQSQLQPPPQPPSQPTSSGRPVPFRSPSMPAPSSSTSSPLSQQYHPPLPTALPPGATMGSVSMRRANSAQTGSSVSSSPAPPPVPPTGKRSTSGRGTPI